MSVDWRKERREGTGYWNILVPEGLEDDSLKSWLNGYERMRDQMSDADFRKAVEDLPGYEAREILSRLWDGEDEQQGWLVKADEEPGRKTFYEAKAKNAIDKAQSVFNEERLAFAEGLEVFTKLGVDLDIVYFPDLQRLDEDGLVSKISGMDIAGLEYNSLAYNRQMRDIERNVVKNREKRLQQEKIEQSKQVDVSLRAEVSKNGSLGKQLREHNTALRKMPTKDSPKTYENTALILDDYLKNKADKAQAVRHGMYNPKGFTMGQSDKEMN